MRVLVCGGRKFSNRHLLDETLDRAGIIILISGAQRTPGAFSSQPLYVGADWLAIEWAVKRQVIFIGHPAPWKLLGNSAGPVRNQAMLDVWKPDKVIAFPGNNGTRDMITRAEVAKIPVEFAGW